RRMSGPARYPSTCRAARGPAEAAGLVARHKGASAMRFREERICKRCGSKIIYTNEVELSLWESRPGCPACFKPQKDADAGDQPEQPQAPESIADLWQWYQSEIGAAGELVLMGVITEDEHKTLVDELRTAVRSMLGLG